VPLTVRPWWTPEGLSHFVTPMTAAVASSWSDLAGWDSQPLENAALSRRTREADIAERTNGRQASSLPSDQKITATTDCSCHFAPYCGVTTL
jgi:hypothetical protein